jgi:catechol 2,3-dioxygenase-like lactoylglutathione lyase family enzyme
MEASLPNATFGPATPVMRVSDLEAAIEYYSTQLGFSLRWRSAIFANVTRDDCQIFLAQGDQGGGRAWAWIGVPDVVALHKEYVAANVKIRNPPSNYEWAMEMQVEDLDGNVLRMGSDFKPDQPIGDWLDDSGRRWQFRQGGWRLMP